MKGFVTAIQAGCILPIQQRATNLGRASVSVHVFLASGVQRGIRC